MTEKPNVPFFLLDREYENHRQAYTDAIHRVLSHGKVLQGKEVEEFENKVARRCSRRFAVAVSSCTDALYFALLCSGIEPGDDVMVTDFSFVASASCIKRLGANPIFIDIDDTYKMDLEKAALAITERTKALIYVHPFGEMGNPDEIEAFARRNHLILIEDAAQAFGASVGGIKAGSLGLISCISFDPTKVVGAPGSAGVFLTDNEKIYRRARKLRYHGKNGKGQFELIGYNSQMPTLTAAMLSVKADFHEQWIRERHRIAQYYIENIDNDLILPRFDQTKAHIFHKFVIRSQNRDRLKKYLADLGIQTMIHYRSPLHREPCFHPNRFSFPSPLVETICSQVLSLPIHPLLTDAEVEHVVKSVNHFQPDR